jgi:hypothetical protein
VGRYRDPRLDRDAFWDRQDEDLGSDWEEQRFHEWYGVEELAGPEWEPSKAIRLAALTVLAIAVALWLVLFLT